jgi:hypothetical protein
LKNTAVTIQIRCIAFQLSDCLETPLGAFPIDGFGCANEELDPYMNLVEVLKDYSEYVFPKYLTPFKTNNGAFWCFDNRSSEVEFPAVVYSHDSHSIKKR